MAEEIQVSAKVMLNRVRKYCRVNGMPHETINNVVGQILKEDALSFEYLRLYGGPNQSGRDSLTNRNIRTGDCPKNWREVFGYMRNGGIARMRFGIKFGSGNPEFKLLDAGCGDGWSLQAYESRGIDCVGVDKSILGVEFSKHSSLCITRPNLMARWDYRMVYDESVNRDARRADLLRLSNVGFEENEFDGINYVGAMMMLPWVEKTTRRRDVDGEEACLQSMLQLKRVHKPGGIMYLLTSNKRFEGEEPEYANPTEKVLMRIIKDAGYNILHRKAAGQKMDGYLLRNEK